MDVSTPPSLDLACPQAKTKIHKLVHMFRDEGVDKKKYRHEGIMITHSTAIHHKDSYGKVTIPSQSKA